MLHKDLISFCFIKFIFAAQHHIDHRKRWLTKRIQGYGYGDVTTGYKKILTPPTSPQEHTKQTEFKAYTSCDFKMRIHCSQNLANIAENVLERLHSF